MGERVQRSVISVSKFGYGCFLEISLTRELSLRQSHATLSWLRAVGAGAGLGDASVGIRAGYPLVALSAQ